MPAAAATARPRLRPRTPAGIAHSSRNARRHGFYAKRYLFSPEEAEALREETQYFIESFRPAGPVALALVRQVALATFQMRRISQVEAEFAARNPGDVLALARLLCALGAIDTRCELLRHRCLRRLDQLAIKENEANEPGNLLKQNGGSTSVGEALERRRGRPRCPVRRVGQPLGLRRRLTPPPPKAG